MSGVGEFRLRELEKMQHTLQYGTGVQIQGAEATGVTLLASNLVRFEGKKTDVNNWRCYLGAWGISAGGTGLATAYATPTPWASGGSPRIFDDFIDINLYAKVQWGAGGVQHMAFVDWQRRGSLFQASGSYLQVDAISTSLTPSGPIIAGRIPPHLIASLGIEPGGGDSEAAATFTYRRQPATLVGPPAGTLFQIPPFARSFTLLLNRAALAAAGAGPITIFELEQPTGGNVNQSWVIPAAAILTETSLTFPISRVGADILVELAAPSGTAATDNIGCMFSLDL